MRAGFMRPALLAALVHCAASTWVLDWSDEFDGPAVNTSNWNILANVSEGNNQIELYTADNVFIDSSDGNSALVLRTRPQNVSWSGASYNITSGRVDSSFKRNLTFGRVEASVKLQNDEAASGIHTALWMLGYECWPVTSEIDIFESQSPSDSYSTCMRTYHKVTSAYHFGPTCNADVRHSTGGSYYPHAAPPPGQGNFSATYTRFSVEWNATDLLYFVNDTQVNHVYNGMPGWPAGFNVTVPQWPMYLILSQAYMAERPCGDPPAWAWPIEQRIDYVRVYRWQPGADGTDD